jgi:putative phage-type endonuclease
MRRVTFDQNTPEWEIWRSKGIGASDAACILGVSPYRTRKQLLDDKVAHWTFSARTTNKKKNSAQLRGTRLEPVARDLYIKFCGIVVIPACIIHDEYDWMRCSLDGLSEDEKTAVEIKCVKEEYHQDAVGGWVPSLYYPQVQHQLAVTGLPVLHYWSYSENGRFAEGEKHALVKVRPNLGYIDRLVAAEKAFWDELVERISEKRPDDLTSTKSVV